VPPNPNLLPNAQSPAKTYIQQPPVQTVPRQPVYPQPGSYYGSNPVYPPQPQVPQQPYLNPVNNPAQTKYLPPNINYPVPPYQQQYNPAYSQYQGRLGQVQPLRLGGAINDQIPLTLTGTNRRPQLGIMDTTADYSWKITGFTECSRKCGEGNVLRSSS
jgi:hypothetical protein